jgi:hypothetical protein
MTFETQILNFANGAGANVLTPAQYAALTSIVQNGFTSGILPSEYLNVVLRQATFIAAALANVIVTQANVNVNDDGNLANLETNMTLAIRAALTNFNNAYAVAQSGLIVPVQPAAPTNTLTLAFAAGNNFVVGANVNGSSNVTNAINGNFVLGTPSGISPGTTQSGQIEFVQNATGGYTITSFSSSWISTTGARPNLTGGANQRDVMYYSVGYDGKIYYTMMNKPL